MPYIPPGHRNAINDGEPATTAGELNYHLTMIVLQYLGPAPTYQKYNDAMGALEGCKLELYRRLVAPYEDTKIAENGDVY